MSATSSDGRDKSARALRERLHPFGEVLEWAGDLAQRLESDARVKRRRIELLVPEQYLDHADVGLLLEQVRGEAVPQRVQMDGLVDLGHPRRGVAGPVELARRERVDWVLPRKQPALRPSHLPPGPQQIEEMLRQHHVSVLAALALLDANDHAGAIDIPELERDDLGGAQSRPVGNAQRRPVLEAR